MSHGDHRRLVGNGILTLSDGRPFTVTSDGHGTGAGLHHARQLRAANPDGLRADARRKWDTRRSRPPWAAPTATARNAARPGLEVAMNMSLFRNIGLGGDKRLELRAEVFNLFNWVELRLPGANVGNAGTFGRITSTLGDPRGDAAGVKFYF
jgi:hypothetical protein